MFSEQFLDSFATIVAERVAGLMSNSSNTQKRLMTVTEVAEYIGKTKQAVYHMVSQNSIPHKYIGHKLRFDREQIDRWIDELDS